MTRDNVPWSTLVTQLTIAAPVIEEVGDDGVEDDEAGEYEEGEGEEEAGGYDPLTAEGYVEEKEEEGVGDEEGEEGAAEKDAQAKQPPKQRQPKLVGRRSKGGSWSGQGYDDSLDSDDEEAGGPAAGSYGSSFDRSSW